MIGNCSHEKTAHFVIKFQTNSLFSYYLNGWRLHGNCMQQHSGNSVVVNEVKIIIVMY